VRFVLLAEGQTEQEAVGTFLKRWLDKQLTPNRVSVDVADLGGSGHFVKEFAKQARLLLAAAPVSNTIGVIGLLDLYGCPPAARNALDLERQVNDPRFRMFYAVHESEAWLLSQPEILPRGVRDALPKKKTAKPETVNTKTPPSKLLNELFKKHLNRKYRKAIHGRKLFAALDPEIARAKCPNLRQMLEVMLEMARAAGL
jgi:hypothetical protein